MVPILHIQKIGGIAGSENHLLLLLPELRKLGFAPTMLVLEDPIKNRAKEFIELMTSKGIPVVTLPIRSHFDPGLAFRIARLLRRSNFTIVHTHLIHADLYGVLAARMTGVPVIFATRHNDDPFRARLLIRVLMNISAWLTSRVVCISYYLKSFISSAEYCSQGKLEVIHYAIDPAPKSALPGFLKTLHIPDGAMAIGMVARLTEQKGHDTLLRAMKDVLGTFPDCHLILVGDGPLRFMLENLAVRIGVSGHTHFTGFMPDAAAAMPHFDIFVHPSRWEGFGLVFLEAMAAKLPIVATRVSAIPEIVEDGVSGLLVNPEDSKNLALCICELLSNAQRRTEMGNAGLERVKKEFSLDKMSSCLAHSYREQMAQRGLQIEGNMYSFRSDTI